MSSQAPVIGIISLSLAGVASSSRFPRHLSNPRQSVWILCGGTLLCGSGGESCIVGYLCLSLPVVCPPLENLFVWPGFAFKPHQDRNHRPSFGPEGPLSCFLAPVHATLFTVFAPMGRILMQPVTAPSRWAGLDELDPLCCSNLVLDFNDMPRRQVSSIHRFVAEEGLVRLTRFKASR